MSGIVGPIIDRQHSPPEVNTDITTFWSTIDASSDWCRSIERLRRHLLPILV
jgi:hypothetical protein